MTGPRRDRPVDAVNWMTGQWIRSCTDDVSSVFCAPSAWPLLALLAHAADGSGRKELEHAVGVQAADGQAAALEILGLMGDMTAVRSALGIWAREQYPLNQAWTSGLPVGTVGRLTGDSVLDTPLLDGWAQQHTGGLIEKMPVEINDETLLVLAAAMSVRTRWIRPFTDTGYPFWSDEGAWRARQYYTLSRVSRIVDRVSVASTNHGEITCLEVLGNDGITVHLVIGEQGCSASQVLEGGLVARRGHGRKGGELRIGEAAPGLVVERVPDDEPDDRLLIRMPRFSVDGDHDLLEHPEVFGLDTVTDALRGHFPAISPQPLAVSQARQRAAARFTAKGFEAAAVTAIAAMGGAMPPVPPRRVKQIRVELDRPFGFFASHRVSGLILAAGWVAEPEPYQPPTEELDFGASL
jgi:serine protease inhibitor